MKKNILICLFFLTLSFYTFAGRIALVQYNADKYFTEYDYNMNKLTEFANEAVKNSANIIVFPEGSTYGYTSKDVTYCKPNKKNCYGQACIDITGVAETVPGGKTTGYWEQFSKDNNAYIVFSILEVDGKNFHNTSVITGPQGYVAKYRKQQLYGPDHCYATPGTELTTFETPYGKFGMMICADVNKKAMFKEYRNMKANGVIIPMDWDEDPNTNRAARLLFQKYANSAYLTLYASDVSPWDGTGAYYSGAKERERNGLEPIAIDQDGITYHELNY